MAVSPDIEPVIGSLPASSRRHFLQGAASLLAFPYLVPGSALGKDGATAASERITVGVIGTGNRGTDDMMGIMGSPLSQVVAVCDCRRPRLEAAGKRVEKFYSERDHRGSYGGCKAYHDFSEVIDRKDIDALIITVPDHWHGIVATRALAAGKDLYCEKPLGRTIAESVAIRDSAVKYKRVFQTGTQQRSDAKFRQACVLARGGHLGKVHTIEVAVPAGGDIVKQPPAPVPDGFDYVNFLECVRDRREPVSSLDSEHRATCLGNVADIAVRLGRKLTWDPGADQFVNDDEANRKRSQPMRSPWSLG